MVLHQILTRQDLRACQTQVTAVVTNEHRLVLKTENQYKSKWLKKEERKENSQDDKYSSKICRHSDKRDSLTCVSSMLEKPKCRRP
jgi:hypothetical protein